MPSEESKQKDRERIRKWREENKEKLKEKRRLRYEANREKELEQQRIYQKENKDKIKQQRKEYYESTKEINKDKEKQRRLKSKDKKREYDKEYRKKYKKRKLELRKEKRKHPMYRINERISDSIRRHLKAHSLLKQGKAWEELVGYSFEELINHLESKFKTGMTWDNYGTYWHIDHITPMSWFSFESTEDEAFKKCWSLSNLQPLEAALNISKGNRFSG